MDIVTREVTVDEGRIEGFIIPDPNDELNRMYIISTIVEIIGLRAEHDYSPEHKIPEADRKLGIQNENYTKIIELIDSVLDNGKLEAYRAVETYVRDYLKSIEKISLFPKFDTVSYWPNHQSDIRLAETVADTMSYLVTYSVRLLETKKEQLEEELESCEEDDKVSKLTAELKQTEADIEQWVGEIHESET